jgi:putative glutamine amidotransferase
VPGAFGDHDVRLVEGSLAARAAGATSHPTKSHHHQGVNEIGEGFDVTGRATVDELVEAIEDPTRRFALGVQWHPEASGGEEIAALVEAARA